MHLMPAQTWPNPSGELGTRATLAEPHHASISQRSHCAEPPARQTPSLTITMQSIPDARQQSFEELYGPPENFLEIEVCAPP
jgi:hypothetical protein